MAVEWKMPRRGERCVACETPFEIGDEIVVCLLELPEGFERHDYCGTCEIPDNPGRIGFWRTHRPRPDAPRARPFDREALVGFFQRLATPETPAQIQFRFVLALLLWRKKALEFESSFNVDEGEMWVFALADKRYEILRPELDEDEVERLSEKLEHLMHSGVLDDADDHGEETPDEAPAAVNDESQPVPHGSTEEAADA